LTAEILKGLSGKRVHDTVREPGAHLFWSQKKRKLQLDGRHADASDNHRMWHRRERVESQENQEKQRKQNGLRTSDQRDVLQLDRLWNYGTTT
jgi:hypothetical protein